MSISGRWELTLRDEYVPFFAGMEAQNRESNDLPWLVEMIDGLGAELGERGYMLRADAFVFLFVNLRVMAIFPWAGLRMRAADSTEIALIIRNDLQRVLQLFAERARDGVLSANAVF